VKAPHGWDEIRKFYCWRDSYMQDLDAWEREMVLVRPPQGRIFTYAGQPARGLRVHPRISLELAKALAEISDAGLWRFVQAIGGGYNFRRMRGANKLSTHSLGAAVDFDPDNNGLGVPVERTALGTEPGLGVVRILEARGWTWGGRWWRPDAMHGQFCSGY
jgi:hypothetical protein